MFYEPDKRIIVRPLEERADVSFVFSNSINFKSVKRKMLIRNVGKRTGVV